MQNSDKPIIKHISSFLEYCEIEKGLSNKTQENYKLFLNRFTRWLAGQNKSDLKPHELSADIIWDYRLYLARNKSPKTGKLLNKSTQNHYLVALRTLLSYFAEKDIQSLPSDKVKLPKEKEKNVKFLKLKQIEKLLQCPNTKNITGKRDRAILETLFSTGLRVSELVNLNREQINPSKNETLLEVPIMGKGDHTRTVYFSPRALDSIKMYLDQRHDDEEALFINYSGPKRANRRLTPKSIEDIVKKYAKLSGLSILVTPHTLRHSFATDMLSQGVDLRLIQEFLGHKNISTTQIYTHVVNKQLKDVYIKHHGGQRINKKDK